MRLQEAGCPDERSRCVHPHQKFKPRKSSLGLPPSAKPNSEVDLFVWSVCRWTFDSIFKVKRPSGPISLWAFCRFAEGCGVLRVCRLDIHRTEHRNSGQQQNRADRRVVRLVACPVPRTACPLVTTPGAACGLEELQYWRLPRRAELQLPSCARISGDVAFLLLKG